MPPVCTIQKSYTILEYKRDWGALLMRADNLKIVNMFSKSPTKAQSLTIE